MHSFTEHLTWVIPLTIASVVTSVTFAALCTYCFKKKRADEEEEEGDEVYQSQEKLPTKKRSSEDIPYLKLPDREERASSLPGTPGHAPIEEPGWGKRSVKYGAMTPTYAEYNVQPPSKELKSILRPKDAGLGLTSSYPEIPTEPEPPSPGEMGDDLGVIYFELSYENMILKLVIKKATGLPAKDITGTSDPFVKVLLLPDKKHKLETRVKRKKLNPIWNEAFTFEGFPHSKLLQKTLYMQVLDYDRFSRNDPIGEIELDLSNVPLQSDPVPFVKNLKPCKRNPVRFSILY